jgi:acyl-CoA dehydrogenase
MNHIYHLPEHQTLRDQVQRFIDREVEPHAMAWEHAGSVPRDVLKRMGDAGFFGLMYESEYGGAEADALTNLVFAEALSQSTFAGSSSRSWYTLIWRARICTTQVLRRKRLSICQM